MKCVVDCKVHLTNKNWPTIATLNVNKKPVGEVDRQTGGPAWCLRWRISSDKMIQRML